MVEFKVEAPGTYVLVDHSLLRAFNKGALGMLKVDGPDNILVYSGKEVDESYLGQQAPEGLAASQRIAELEKKVETTIQRPRGRSVTRSAWRRSTSSRARLPPRSSRWSRSCRRAARSLR
jgi:hypothetical protein